MSAAERGPGQGSPNPIDHLSRFPTSLDPGINTTGDPALDARNGIEFLQDMDPTTLLEAFMGKKRGQIISQEDKTLIAMNLRGADNANKAGREKLEKGDFDGVKAEAKVAKMFTDAARKIAEEYL